MKAIILARVSDKSQDSNAAQIARISTYTQSKGLSVWKEFQIEESSTTADRKKFQEVLKEIHRSKEPIALVVDTVDRLQRSFKESVVLDDLRREGKLEIHFYRENLILNKNSNSADLLRWDVAVMFARSYVLQLKDNMARKLDEMLKVGKWISKAPLGYRTIRNAEGKRTDMILDPDSAHLVRKMFVLYASGNHSIATVTAEITKLGLRSRAGQKLTPSMVDRLLQNPFYYGEMVSKGQLHRHNYEALISRHLFDKCRLVRLSWHKKPFQYAAKPFVFRGLLRCATCGCSMTPFTAKKKYAYYRCTNARKDICNSSLCISEADLLKPIMDALGTFRKIPKKTINDVVERLRNDHGEIVLAQKQSVESLKREQLGVQQRIDRLVDLLMDNVIERQDYDRRMQGLKERQLSLSAQLEVVSEIDESAHITASRVFGIADRTAQLFESGFTVEEKRAFLNYALQNSVVQVKTPLYVWRSPFTEILALANQPAGGAYWDLNPD